MADLSEVPKNELLRRKEMVEWQITIAKSPQILKEKEQRLEEINNQLLKLQ